MKKRELALIIDFGSPYNQTLTRKIRQLGVYSELHPHTISDEEIVRLAPSVIILSGGPYYVNDEHRFRAPEAVFALDVPVLGIGYGMQLIAEHFGGEVSLQHETTYEKKAIEFNKESRLNLEIPQKQDVLLSEGYTIEQLPPQFNVDAKTENGEIAAFSHGTKPIFGVKFHPEAEDTDHGFEQLKNFLFTISELEGTWSAEQFMEEEIERIKQIVGDEKVLCALSGGVDSSVVATLIHRAIGDQLTCIFVDHGLLRKNEAEEVMGHLAKDFNLNIIHVDASDRFFNKLKGVTDPEEKRKIIGNEFIEVFNEEAGKLTDITFLAQGTLYSDVIESGMLTGKIVKSHHNVGGLPEDLEFKLLEPLRTLFKDEVRALGTALGLPDHIVWRQPFPGPGLGIRVLGEVTREKVAIVREADAILREEIRNARLDRDIWQYFAVLPNIRSVGIRDDKRSYDYTIGIRAVHSVDGMTSEFARIDWDVLAKISERIVKEVDQVNRVVYDITSKPPSTIEWE